MIVTLWGTRGSLACSGPEIEKYGGNTSCVEVRGLDDTVLVLDAGTGIRRLGLALTKKVKKVHILLTHLHLDHIQGLGFFAPLYDENVEVHIYGPASSKRHLYSLLTKYLSPPLFPVLLRDLPCQLFLHEVPLGEFAIGEFRIRGQYVCHPGLTLGYRIASHKSVMAYIPDHEPACGVKEFPAAPEWTSGFDLAKGVDLLIHDAQYTHKEYQDRSGWGHSTIEYALKFAKLVKAKSLVTFHHDPAHNDEELDALLEKAIETVKPDFNILAGREGSAFELE